MCTYRTLRYLTLVTRRVLTCKVACYLKVAIQCWPSGFVTLPVNHQGGVTMGRVLSRRPRKLRMPSLGGIDKLLQKDVFSGTTLPYFHFPMRYWSDLALESSDEYRWERSSSILPFFHSAIGWARFGGTVD